MYRLYLYNIYCARVTCKYLTTLQAIGPADQVTVVLHIISIITLTNPTNKSVHKRNKLTLGSNFSLSSSSSTSSLLLLYRLYWFTRVIKYLYDILLWRRNRLNVWKQHVWKNECAIYTPNSRTRGMCTVL